MLQSEESWLIQKFDWQSDKFPLLNEPESSYHGIRWAHDLGPLSPIALF